MTERRRVLVVGGAGYIGSVLVEALLEKGYAVRVLDRLFFGREPLAAFEGRIELVVEDMRDCDERHMEGCFAVINVGGLSNDPTAEFNPLANAEMNTVASIRVAEAARRAGCERLILASSASVYDRGVSDEQSDVLQDEDAPVSPTAAYAASKLGAELGVLPLASPDFAPVAFRQGTVYGWSARMRFDLVVNTFVKDALTSGKLHLTYGGEMWRPLVAVEDVVAAYLLALECDPDIIRGQTFNLAAGNTRISELALRVQSVLASMEIPARIEPDYVYRGKLRNYRIDSARVRAALGWRPAHKVEDSVRHMVDRIRHHKVDLGHPRHLNIAWMTLLEEVMATTGQRDYVLTKPVGALVP